MNCPKCQHAGFVPDKPCPKCKFSGDTSRIEELAHVDWVLDDLDTWGKDEIPHTTWLKLQERYETRKNDLEIALGLRQPPFTSEEAQVAWPKLIRYEIIDQKLAEWLEAGDLDPKTSQFLANQLHERVSNLTERLAGHSRPVEPPNDADQLEIWKYIFEVVNRLGLRNAFTNPQTELEYRAFLQSEIDELETKLGLRAPEPAPSLPSTPAPQPSVAPAPAVPVTPKEPPPPKIPLRERLWKSLLSERTLHAILFLGIFLLFTAAVSFVIWGWQDFSAPLRVAIPTGFTLLFFGLGWLVRTKTALYRSGIALSAIAALLIPIDFYTLYVNFGSPPAYWAEFWLLASLICIIIYAAVTFTIQSRFFGYLVVMAAGSAVLASVEVSHQYWGVSQDWASAAISILALVLILLAAALTRLPESSRWRVFVDPFCYLALLSVGVIMPLTLAWRYLNRDTFDTLHTALSINWWIGGLVFGWGAIRYRSRSLGLLAIISLPVAVYLTQAGIFSRAGVNPAWQAFGLACLVPLYFFVAYRLSQYPDDPVLFGHSRSAIGCGSVLVVIAAVWSLTDLSSGAAAASSHAVLSATLVMTALLWQRPRQLYGASLFSFTAVTFAITELGLTLGQSGVGWASLALFHIFVAVYLGNRFSDRREFIAPLVISGYTIAGLAVLVPLYPYDAQVLSYTLGNWLVLSGWGAFHASRGQIGFDIQHKRLKAIFHWGAALPLPIWFVIVLEQRSQIDVGLPLTYSVLSWGMFVLGLWVGRFHREYRQPWNVVSLLVSITAPILAFIFVPQGYIPAICLLASGLLYFADAAILNRSRELAAAGLVTAWGYYLFIQRSEKLSFDALTFSIAILVSVYILVGLWAEWKQRKPNIQQFLAPLYIITHLLVFAILLRVFLRPLGYLFNESWTDAMRLWGAATLILLGIIYLLYAWGSYREFWAHMGVWLLAFGGGFVIIAYSSGQGRSAVLAALGAIGFVLSERVLNWLRTYAKFTRRQKVGILLIWRLIKTPLLLAGWLISLGAILLSLYRNLVILGGGRPQQIWAALGLLLITGLYALSAYLFRKVRFVWFAGILSFLPWTIMTNLGWFTPWRFTQPSFGASWVIFAGVLFLISLRIARWDRAYALPMQIIANLVVVASLLWASGNNQASRYALALAIAFYGFAAWLDHRQAKQTEDPVSAFTATRYFYPALALIPVWFLYALAWRFPNAGVEHYGLLLLLFTPIGLISGQWLERRAPGDALRRNYGFPAYFIGYISLFFGTVLVLQSLGLLSMVLLYDAAILLVSAWLFRNPYWLYSVVVLVPVSLWISLDQHGIWVERRGWWLIGLAAIYLSQAWLARRAKLTEYGNVALYGGLILILVGLQPSSQDEISAFWGYLGAVILYTITAFWLRQPFILALASFLAVVPYAVAIRQLGIPSEFYGLALYPGAVVALALGWLLDRKFGAWERFPWSKLEDWPEAILDRFLGWWALSLYLLGFGFTSLSALFTSGRTDLMALNFALMIPVFGWAIYRFRLRFWLAALLLALHFSWATLLDSWGWWGYPAYAWQRFAPVTLGILFVALYVQGSRGEKSPLKSFSGWSQVLYCFVIIDVLLSQAMSLDGEAAGAVVSLINALIIAICASAWRSSGLVFFSTALGAVALAQLLQSIDGPIQGLPVAYAYLAMGYGVAGFLLTVARRRGSGETQKATIPAWLSLWESPLQISGLLLSFGVLILTLVLGVDLAGWFARALMGLSFREIVDLTTVQMVVQVGSILGLLYLATSIVYRRLRVGYLAVGMLLGSWLVYAFYIQEWDNLIRLQWYAIPAGLYLLGVAYLEWGQGNRILARWLDYAAIVLMLGSLFWQTMVFGWTFALMMGAEGLAAIWWGSARRLRRFFYAGIVGVVLATIGQLLNALQHINQWVTFGIIGLLLVAVGIIVERQRERLKLWQDSMDDWE